MPVFRSGDRLPDWCEMVHFDVVRLGPGEDHHFSRMGKKERLFVCEGLCRIELRGTIKKYTRGAQLDLEGQGGAFDVVEVARESLLVRVCGHWGAETGGSGLFSVEKSTTPIDKGDPVEYTKETNFDAHYHDYDEYWIFYRGRGVAVSEGNHYLVKPGDCVATGMGHHHDIPRVASTLEGVFFETTIGGEKRKGHLWNHTHGPTEPQPERV
jgi:mannose-6-phosphate isomerase-like protein (cupin superfamily)